MKTLCVTERDDESSIRLKQIKLKECPQGENTSKCNHNAIKLSSCDRQLMMDVMTDPGPGQISDTGSLSNNLPFPKESVLTLCVSSKYFWQAS